MRPRSHCYDIKREKARVKRSHVRIETLPMGCDAVVESYKQN